MKKIRVLIAEDIEVLRNNLKEMLEADIEIEVVAQASSGREAVALALQHKPEIILMDIEMEDATAGISAANRIFASNPAIKIIFLTMHEDDFTIINAMATGAVDYIIKTADCKNAIEHIKKAHKDAIEMDRVIQKVLHGEFVKLSKSRNDQLDFIRKVMQVTTCEKEIIRLLLKNKKTSEIAAARFVEPVTIKKQIGMILKKFEVRRSKEIVHTIRELEMESLFGDD